MVLWPEYVVRVLNESISGEQHPGWAVEEVIELVIN